MQVPLDRRPEARHEVLRGTRPPAAPPAPRNAESPTPPAARAASAARNSAVRRRGRCGAMRPSRALLTKCRSSVARRLRVVIADRSIARNGPAARGHPPRSRRRSVIGSSPSSSAGRPDSRRDEFGRIDRQVHRCREDALLAAEVVMDERRRRHPRAARSPVPTSRRSHAQRTPSGPLENGRPGVDPVGTTSAGPPDRRRAGGSRQRFRLLRHRATVRRGEAERRPVPRPGRTRGPRASPLGASMISTTTRPSKPVAGQGPPGPRARLGSRVRAPGARPDWAGAVGEMQVRQPVTQGTCIASTSRAAHGGVREVEREMRVVLVGRIPAGEVGGHLPVAARQGTCSRRRSGHAVSPPSGDALHELARILALPAERRVHDDRGRRRAARRRPERAGACVHGSVVHTRWVMSRQGAWTAAPAAVVVGQSARRRRGPG